MNLEVFYKKYEWYIENQARFLTRSTLDYDLVVGTATEKIVSAFQRGTYVEDGKAFAWIKRVVSNVWKDELRKKAKSRSGKSVSASYYNDNEEFEEDRHGFLG